MKQSLLRKYLFLIAFFLFIILIFVITLTCYIFNKQKLFLYTTIILGMIILFIIYMFVYYKLHYKYYSIAFNHTYYSYNQNIITDSKYLKSKKIKNIKLKKISLDGIIEYRIIDNEYVIQKIGLIKLDSLKTLIIFYTAHTKIDYEGSLLDINTFDYQKNRELFINILGIKEINKEHVYYSNNKKEAIVIENYNNAYRCITYFYTIDNYFYNLNDALNYCNPYWTINREYLVKTFETFEEAESFVLQEMKFFNKEK